MLDSLRSVIQFRELELDPVERRLARVASVADLRRIAKRRLPGGVFDYIDGGAEDEITLGRNLGAFADIELRPRVLRDVGEIDTTTDLFGRSHSFPLVMAPTGFGRIADPQGELAVARAAQRAGVPYTLSTMGTRSIEEVAEVSSGEKWMQVYVWRDRGMVKELIDRAHEAGNTTIVITVDTAVLGRRERDVRRGFTLPPKIGPETLIDGALHPSWTLDFLRSEPITFSNVTSADADGSGTAVNLAQYINSQFDPGLSWADIEWFRSIWPGEVVLKGVQGVDDAVIAAENGVDGIALSNHGGRQLDNAPTPIELVGPVAEAVGDRMAIICDGGVRRGSDIFKALALGADAVMIGRAYLYALGAGGERGVDWVLDHLVSGLRQTMVLSGCTTIADIDADLVSPPR
ncbi:MAG: alpha-hydroxy-acid oxidizing protein [Actinomycetia bacterium]|nr:alpha-hydroxy-acid oxidizing protein [Actinomycetes bacterium]MCP3911686.1 alpha-hydroxy-acid oxidizing protein [Actinomycetes bacterium]MCP4086955.1 alpha-hydroxy-acid oxidizing protein [Actinomycetes bacterium]